MMVAMCYDLVNPNYLEFEVTRVDCTCNLILEYHKISPQLSLHCLRTLFVYFCSFFQDLSYAPFKSMNLFYNLKRKSVPQKTIGEGLTMTIFVCLQKSTVDGHSHSGMDILLVKKLM